MDFKVTCVSADTLQLYSYSVDSTTFILVKLTKYFLSMCFACLITSGTNAHIRSYAFGVRL